MDLTSDLFDEVRHLIYSPEYVAELLRVMEQNDIYLEQVYLVEGDDIFCLLYTTPDSEDVKEVTSLTIEDGLDLLIDNELEFLASQAETALVIRSDIKWSVDGIRRYRHD